MKEEGRWTRRLEDRGQKSEDGKDEKIRRWEDQKAS